MELIVLDAEIKKRDVERTQRVQSKPLTSSFERGGGKCRDNNYRSWWGP